MQTTLQRARSRQSSRFVTFRTRSQPRYRSLRPIIVDTYAIATAPTCSICVHRRYNSTVSAFSRCCDRTLSLSGGPARPLESRPRGPLVHSIRSPSARYFSTAAPSPEPPEPDSTDAEAPIEISTAALDDVALWSQLFRSLRTSHGDEGVWAFFELLREKHRIHLLCKDSLIDLRKAVVEVAVLEEKKLETLLGVATRLRVFQQEWPGLYGDAMSALLRQAKYTRAIECHHQLSESLHPGPDVVASTLSDFILDPSQNMQKCLKEIYTASPWRNFYARIIPLLYDAGCSRLARSWRKVFVKHEDTETSQACRPFVKFLDHFYPIIELTQEESNCLRAQSPKVRRNAISGRRTSIGGTFRDEFVAKTFASKWLSLDFALNSIHRLGLKEIGPRAMQALALRETTAEKVATRIAQVEKLGLVFSDRAYCNSLVSFARNGEDKLLSQLLTCDVHPDEFDDPLTRARMAQQPGLKTLMHGVDWALEVQTSRVQLNRLLGNVLHTRHMGKALLILGRMDALKISLTQQNADILLLRATHGLSIHTPDFANKTPGASARLDRFIVVLRKLLHHDVGVSIDHWQLAFYLLGRLGRFDEWLQLALEVIHRYQPERGGLIPLHRRDRLSGVGSIEEAKLKARPKARSKPKSKPKPKSQEGNTEVSQGSDVDWDGMPIIRSLEAFNYTIPKTDARRRRRSRKRVEETDWVPSDLKFNNERHPLTRIFDDKLQRAILRWGWDQALLDWPKISIGGPRIPHDYDIATGLYIVKVLRNHGILVKPSLVRAVIVRRSILSQLPSRRHRARDTQEVELLHIMRIVARVWGPDLLGTYDEYEESVAAERAKMWRTSRHEVDFGRDYASVGTMRSISDRFDNGLEGLLEDQASLESSYLEDDTGELQEDRDVAEPSQDEGAKLGEHIDLAEIARDYGEEFNEDNDLVELLQDDDGEELQEDQYLVETSQTQGAAPTKDNGTTEASPEDGDGFHEAFARRRTEGEEPTGNNDLTESAQDDGGGFHRAFARRRGEGAKLEGNHDVPESAADDGNRFK